MPITQKLALASVAIGLLLGLLVLAAATIARRSPKLPFWLGGTVWGVLTAGLILTDCLHPSRVGPVSELAFPVYFGGLLAWPICVIWGERPWALRWLLAQLVLLVSLGLVFLVAVGAAMCGLP